MANAKILRGVGGRRNAWGVGVARMHVVRKFARLLYKQVALPKFALFRLDYQNRSHGLVCTEGGNGGGRGDSCLGRGVRGGAGAPVVVSGIQLPPAEHVYNVDPAAIIVILMIVAVGWALKK